MKNLSFIFIFYLGIFYNSDTYGLSFHQVPVKIKNRFDYLNQVYDTLIVYNRSCSACKEGLPFTMYYIYRNNGKFYLEAYTWRIGNKNRYKVRRKYETRGLVANAFYYATQNLDSIILQADYIDLRYSKKYVQINDSVTQVEFPYRGNHGPFVEYHIKCGNVSYCRTLTGVSVFDFCDVAPIITRFLVNLNSTYSKYTTTDIVDWDR